MITGKTYDLCGGAWVTDYAVDSGITHVGVMHSNILRTVCCSRLSLSLSGHRKSDDFLLSDCGSLHWNGADHLGLVVEFQALANTI